MSEENKLLTIGQFAALHGINKKTLMWYDEIGLFKPAAINPENGYPKIPYQLYICQPMFSPKSSIISL